MSLKHAKSRWMIQFRQASFFGTNLSKARRIKNIFKKHITLIIIAVNDSSQIPQILQTLNTKDDDDLEHLKYIISCVIRYINTPKFQHLKEVVGIIEELSNNSDDDNDDDNNDEKNMLTLPIDLLDHIAKFLDQISYLNWRLVHTTFILFPTQYDNPVQNLMLGPMVPCSPYSYHLQELDMDIGSLLQQNQIDIIPHHCIESRKIRISFTNAPRSNNQGLGLINFSKTEVFRYDGISYLFFNMLSNNQIPNLKELYPTRCTLEHLNNIPTHIKRQLRGIRICLTEDELANTMDFLGNGEQWVKLEFFGDLNTEDEDNNIKRALQDKTFSNLKKVQINCAFEAILDVVSHIKLESIHLVSGYRLDVYLSDALKKYIHVLNCEKLYLTYCPLDIIRELPSLISKLTVQQIELCVYSWKMQKDYEKTIAMETINILNALEVSKIDFVFTIDGWDLDLHLCKKMILDVLSSSSCLDIIYNDDRGLCFKKK